EVEAMGGRREDMNQSTAYMKMAVNQLLFEMDGVDSNNSNVLVVGATNAPWDVDPALRRSGRFGKAIIISEPDMKSRADILKLHVKKVPAAKGICYTRLALATVDYASADLKAIVEEAATIPWRQAYKTGSQRAVTTEDFITAIKKKKSSLPPWYAQAKKQIGSQEEKTVVDGKEHVKVTESKLASAEKEAFKELLDIIKRKNQIYYKAWVWIVRNFGLYVPIPF
ncbi:MAG: ATP-binding protein, partial [Candidatus Micrarchaeota archaeon]|nr:ATP-binding protein [Candidatus Micrarchaeota archaeon]